MAQKKRKDEAAGGAAKGGPAAPSKSAAAAVARATERAAARPAKDAKGGHSTALDDALELLLAAVHVGRLKTLPREKYAEELKRVRVLQRIVAKAVTEGNAPPALARSLAKHFDAVLEGL